MRLWAIGGCLIDIVAKAQVPFIAGTSCPGRVRRSPGGVARNVAALVASAQGQRVGSVELITGVGDDPEGAWLLSDLQQAQIGIGHTRRIAGARTGSYVAVHDDHGRMISAVVDMDVFSVLTPDAIHTALLTRSADDLVFADGNLSLDCLTMLAEELGTALIVDAVSVTKAKRLRGALNSGALLFMNHDEADSLLGYATPSALAAGEALKTEGALQAVVTDGSGPLIALIQGDIRQYAVEATPMVDETGAGDALIAGCIAALMAGVPLHAAIDHGLQAARSAVQVSGAFTRLS